MLSERDKIIFKKSLTYANGYRELGMFDDALQELDSLSESFAAQKELKQMQLAIYMEAQRWEPALQIANVLASSYAEDPGNFVNLAYITRRASNIDEARIILENAARRFPQEAIIHYNLGCYAACNKDLDTAKKHLLAAFALDPTYLEMSYNDQDLANLTNWLANIPKST